jgi:isobutyryl-CoA mutase small subunit
MTPITAGEDRPPAPAAAGGAAPSPAEAARAAASSVRAQAGPTEEAAGQARPVAGAHEDPARAVEGQGKIRVVVAKPGLDGHDRGAKIVARALRDAGMEVIYTGLHQTPEQIVETALQEDADGIGLSVLSGAHMTLFRRVLELLHERDAGDVVVFGGGIIPDDDIPQLEQLGVAKVFTPGASTQSIIDWVRTNVRAA